MDFSNKNIILHSFDEDVFDMFSLPRGAGYKSEWLVADGSNQSEIEQKLALTDCKRVSYDEGLRIIENSPYSDRTVMICPDYNGQNYIFSSSIADMIYQPEETAELFKNIYRVYMYATMRVSEAHYFGLFERGEILRYYRFDEEEIISIGEPLPRELAQGINLPSSFEEWDSVLENGDESVFTDMNEDIIINLASGQTGVDEDNYPYTDVIIGVLP